MLVLLTLNMSCITPDNYGYPQRVNLKAQGGEITLSGDHGIYSIEIVNYDGEGTYSKVTDATDSLIVVNDWLTAKARLYDHKITIIADRNTGKKKNPVHNGIIGKTKSAILKNEKYIFRDFSPQISNTV